MRALAAISSGLFPRAENTGNPATGETLREYSATTWAVSSTNSTIHFSRFQSGNYSGLVMKSTGHGSRFPRPRFLHDLSGRTRSSSRDESLVPRFGEDIHIAGVPFDTVCILVIVHHLIMRHRNEGGAHFRWRVRHVKLRGKLIYVARNRAKGD